MDRKTSFLLGWLPCRCELLVSGSVDVLSFPTCQKGCFFWGRHMFVHVLLKAWPMPSVPRITHYIDYAAGGLVLINSFALMFLGTTKLVEVIGVKCWTVDTAIFGVIPNCEGVPGAHVTQMDLDIWGIYSRLSQGRCYTKLVRGHTY